MAELFHNGVIVDLILLLVVLEFLALIALRRFWGKGPAPSDWLPSLVAGACLLLALRATIAQATWLWAALFLTLSLVAHLTDLARRF
jgi:hypothetical protein